MKLWESALLVANTYGLNFIKIGRIWIFWGGGGRNPPLWGLHVTCDAHFRTWLSYSSQKSCVKIWFGLVEIGGMWIFREGGGGEGEDRSCLLGGLHVTCDVHLRTWPSYSSQKTCVKIWFGLVEPFKSYRVHKQTYKHPPPPKKKEKKKTRMKTVSLEKYFSGG